MLWQKLNWNYIYELHSLIRQKANYFSKHISSLVETRQGHYFWRRGPCAGAGVCLYLFVFPEIKFVICYTTSALLAFPLQRLQLNWSHQCNEVNWKLSSSVKWARLYQSCKSFFFCLWGGSGEGWEIMCDKFHTSLCFEALLEVWTNTHNISYK